MCFRLLTDGEAGHDAHMLGPGTGVVIITMTTQWKDVTHSCLKYCEYHLWSITQINRRVKITQWTTSVWQHLAKSPIMLLVFLSTRDQFSKTSASSYIFWNVNTLMKLFSIVAMFRLNPLFTFCFCLYSWHCFGKPKCDFNTKDWEKNKKWTKIELKNVHFNFYVK